jgi:predicted GH43/DUF377 family glycosyl hydrolase
MMKKIFLYFFVTAVFAIRANGQVNWTKHSGNPVLPRGVSGAWDDVAVGSPTIIYNGTMYQMWYNGSDGSNANIGYATSTDKINWDKHPTPVLEHGPNGSCDDVNALHPSVYFDGTTYHMWYTGVNGSFGQIGYATSPDSINWTKHSGNPVLTLGQPGSWDDQSINSPDVLFFDGVFHMWYVGFNGNFEQIGHATSLNGIDWEKDTLNPVLKVGDFGSWDNASSSQPSVLYDGTNFHIWYGGGPDFDWKIGYAFSEDGRNWHKDDTNNPVLEPGLTGDWDIEYVGYHTVCFNSDSTGFDMWYTGAASAGYSGDIGYATAPLEIPSFENTWYKYPSNPVFEGEPGEFDSDEVQHPSIVVNDKQYHMWYSGYGGGDGSRVGYAVSDDGISWARHPNPILQTGSAGAWDDYSVQGTSVLYKDSIWHMWYTGYDGDGDFSFQIGYATSTDKINWTKYENNPVLGLGAGGEWDDAYVGWMQVLFIDGIYHMWYTGRDGAINQIGHATSADGISWEKDPGNPVLTVGATGAWDDRELWNPDVYFDGYLFHMWYGGSQETHDEWRIGYAVSIDGSSWQKISTKEPVMDVGSAGQWDEQYVAAGVAIIVEIVEEDTLLKMWYGGGNAAYVGKIGYAQSDPDFTPVGVEDNKINVVPTEYSLSQNYPNPFNPTTKIRYQVPATGLVSLRVFNLLGEVVVTLVNEEKPVGTYELTWNTENLSSGVYFYRLQAGSFVETKKMILLR